MASNMDKLCSMCQAGVPHDCNGGTDRHPPKGRGSNYERTKHCPRCDRRTTHLFDHGEGLHLCAECEI